MPKQNLLSHGNLSRSLPNSVSKAKKQFELAKPQVLLVDYQLRRQWSMYWKLIMLWLRENAAQIYLPLPDSVLTQEEENQTSLYRAKISTYLSKPIKPLV